MMEERDNKTALMDEWRGSLREDQRRAAGLTRLPSMFRSELVLSVPQLQL